MGKSSVNSRTISDSTQNRNFLNLGTVESLLITGSNGFVGQSIVNQISHLDQKSLPKKIVLATRAGLTFTLPESLESITTFVSQDLSKEWEFDHNVSHLINLAADGSNSPYSENANQVFTAITRNLISWIGKSHSNPKVFHASSGACFGRFPIDGIKDESYTKSNFEINRINAEALLKNSAANLDFELTIGRLFTFSGNLLLSKGQYAITDFIKSAIDSRNVIVSGDPRTVRSYLHQDAMAHWILKSLIMNTAGMTLQIGSSHAVTIKELAEFIAQKTSTQVTYNNSPAIGDIYLPKNEETRTKLGVEEGVNWNNAVEEMIDFLRMDKND
jgi:nucleoside-diphosphate-sugar epimerase